MSRVRLVARAPTGGRVVAAVVGAGLGRGRPVGGQHGSTGGVTYAQLELPLLGPGLLLLVLAKLHEKGVTALGKIDVELVLVDAYAAMIFVAAEHQLAVVPDLPGIFAAQP